MSRITKTELINSLIDAGYIRKTNMDKMINGGKAYWYFDELLDINKCVGIFPDKKIMCVYNIEDDSCDWNDPEEIFTLSEGYKWLTKIDNVNDCVEAAYEIFQPGNRFNHSRILVTEAYPDMIILRLCNGKKVTMTFEVK